MMFKILKENKMSKRSIRTDLAVEAHEFYIQQTQANKQVQAGEQIQVKEQAQANQQHKQISR